MGPDSELVATAASLIAALLMIVAGMQTAASASLRPLTAPRFRATAPGNSTAPMLRPNLLGIAYLVIGVFLAANRNYYESVHTAKQIGSAILATVLWPLLLLGINLHIR